MRTTAWGVAKTMIDGKAHYTPTEFEIEDGQVVKAIPFNQGVYEALAYAALPDIIEGFYRAHLTRMAVQPQVKPGKVARPAGRVKS